MQLAHIIVHKISYVHLSHKKIAQLHSPISYEFNGIKFIKITLQKHNEKIRKAGQVGKKCEAEKIAFED